MWQQAAAVQQQQQQQQINSVSGSSAAWGRSLAASLMAPPVPPTAPSPASPSGGGGIGGQGFTSAAGTRSLNPGGAAASTTEMFAGLSVSSGHGNGGAHGVGGVGGMSQSSASSSFQYGHGGAQMAGSGAGRQSGHLDAAEMRSTSSADTGWGAFVGTSGRGAQSLGGGGVSSLGGGPAMGGGLAGGAVKGPPTALFDPFAALTAAALSQAPAPLPTGAQYSGGRHPQQAAPGQLPPPQQYTPPTQQYDSLI